MPRISRLEVELHNGTATDAQILAHVVRKALLGMIARLDRTGEEPTWEQSHLMSRLLKLLNRLEPSGQRGRDEWPDEG